jgi:hypothetical protein
MGGLHFKTGTAYSRESIGHRYAENAGAIFLRPFGDDSIIHRKPQSLSHHSAIA